MYNDDKKYMFQLLLYISLLIELLSFYTNLVKYTERLVNLPCFIESFSAVFAVLHRAIQLLLKWIPNGYTFTMQFY